MENEALQRSGFVFYETYYRIMRALDGEACKALLTAMCEYALYGTEPKEFESDLISGLWFCFRKTLYEGRKNAQNRTKKPQNKQEEEKKQPENKPSCGKSNGSETTEAKPVSSAPAAKSAPVAPERSVRNENAAPERYEEEMTEAEREYVRPLAEMGIEIDECIGEMDVDKIKEEFSKSAFLRKTFRSVSKIARNYNKVINGVYRDSDYIVKENEPKKESFQRHEYSAERLKNALVHFD